MKAVQLIAVFAENKLGQMARITQVLVEARVNLCWVAFATSEKFGVIKMLVDQTDVAFHALQKQGWTVSRIEVLAVEAPNQPGGLHTVVDCLTRHGINIENASGFVANQRAVLLIEVQDIAAARRALAQEKLPLLARDEVVSL